MYIFVDQQNNIYFQDKYTKIYDKYSISTGGCSVFKSPCNLLIPYMSSLNKESFTNKNKKNTYTALDPWLKLVPIPKTLLPGWPVSFGYKHKPGLLRFTVHAKVAFYTQPGIDMFP